MSFPKYPEYKDSGVEWLGDVPAHWRVAPVQSKFLLRNGYPFVAEQFTTIGVSEDRLIRIRDILGNEAPIYTNEPCPKHCLVENGDVLIGMDGDFNICLWTCGAAKLNQRVCAVRGVSKSWDKLFFYAISNPLKVINDLTFSTTVKHLASSQVLKLRFPYPSESEAEKIVTFLDHETSKIDTLIAEQQRLIELLKEKRQAVISHAVTKGLNPNAPMKESGVEWLGEVPAHWDVKPLRHIGVCQNGINIGGDAFGTGFPFVSYGDVYRNSYLPDRVSGLVESTKEDRVKYSVKKGDVFFTRTSETVEEIGFSATCLRDIDGAVFAGFLIRFRPFCNKLVPEYSRYYFGCQNLRAFFNKEMNLVTRASLSQDLLKLLPVPVPPFEEQEQIASHLQCIDQRFLQLIDESHSVSKILVERRSALISASVTGKIDVREWGLS